MATGLMVTSWLEQMASDLRYVLLYWERTPATHCEGQSGRCLLSSAVLSGTFQLAVLWVCLCMLLLRGHDCYANAHVSHAGIAVSVV